MAHDYEEEREHRERRVPGPTRDDEDDQLRRLWRREPERSPPPWRQEPRGEPPDFGWWGPW